MKSRKLRESEEYLSAYESVTDIIISGKKTDTVDLIHQYEDSILDDSTFEDEDTNVLDENEVVGDNIPQNTIGESEESVNGEMEQPSCFSGGALLAPNFTDDLGYLNTISELHEIFDYKLPILLNDFKDAATMMPDIKTDIIDTIEDMVDIVAGVVTEKEVKLICENCSKYSSSDNSEYKAELNLCYIKINGLYQELSVAKQQSETLKNEEINLTANIASLNKQMKQRDERIEELLEGDILMTKQLNQKDELITELQTGNKTKKEILRLEKEIEINDDEIVTLKR